MGAPKEALVSPPSTIGSTALMYDESSRQGKVQLQGSSHA